MFKKLLVLTIFSCVLFSNAYAQDDQEIGDVVKYVQDIESKLSCPIKNTVGLDIKDMFDRKVDMIVYFCPDGVPALQQADILNDKGFVALTLDRTSFGQEFYIIREKYNHFNDNNTIEKTVEHAVKYYSNGKVEKISSIYEEFSDKGKKLKVVTIKPDFSKEQTLEYFSDGTVSKNTNIVITAKDTDEFIEEYSQAGKKIKETEISYDVETSKPYKKTITEYDASGLKIVSVVMYDYKDGVENVKTVSIYEKGKLVANVYYELIYDANGALLKEKKIGKDVY